jgi:8-oxo-dGTP pyrophosphatase MutT (NUDIX family)
VIAKKISLEAAKENKLFYFVANAVIYRDSDHKCLILKRSEREIVYPGKWALPGGKLEWENLDIKKPTRVNNDVLDFENSVIGLLEREIFEEAGIKIKSPYLFIGDVAFIRPDGIPVILIKLAVKYKSGKVKIDKFDFSDHAWVDQKTIKEYDGIDGLDVDIKQTISLFSQKY